MELGINVNRRVKRVRICSGKSCVFIGAPLHRSPDAIAIAQINIIAHPDLVTVVKNRAPWHGEQQRMNQLQFPAIIAEKRR